MCVYQDAVIPKGQCFSLNRRLFRFFKRKFPFCKDYAGFAIHGSSFYIDTMNLNPILYSIQSIPFNFVFLPHIHSINKKGSLPCNQHDRPAERVRTPPPDNRRRRYGTTFLRFWQEFSAKMAVIHIPTPYPYIRTEVLPPLCDKTRPTKLCSPAFLPKNLASSHSRRIRSGFPFAKPSPLCCKEENISPRQMFGGGKVHG